MAASDAQQEPPPSAPVDDGDDGRADGSVEGVQSPPASASSDDRLHDQEEARPGDSLALRVTPLATAPMAMRDALALKDAELQQLQKTHDEFVKSSGEYERELESEIERCEKKARALELSVCASEAAREQLVARLGEAQTQLEAAVQRERAVALELEEMKWKVQRLEQANDELETAARIAQASVADLEHKNETLLEQTVFLAQEKEEVARQLASITVAEVHPVLTVGGGGSALTLASGPSLMNVLPLLRQHTEKAAAATGGGASQQKQQPPTRGKAKTRYPDVVESCIHITCQKCRAGSGRSRSPHRHLGLSHHGSQARQHRRSSAASSSFDGAASAKTRAAPPSVFARMRLRFRSLFNCSEEKAAGAASASKS